MRKKLLFLCVCLLSILSAAVADDEIMYYQGIEHDSCIWMATNSGLQRFKIKKGRSKTFSSPDFKDIKSLTISEKGEIVVCSTEGLGIFDKSSFVKCDTILFSNASVLMCHNGLWAGNPRCLYQELPSGRVLYFSPYPNLTDHDFRSLAWSEKEQKMWFGAHGNANYGGKLGYVDSVGIYSIDKATANINGILVRDDGSLLIASSDGLLACVDNVIEKVETPYDSENFEVTAIANKDSYVWLGAGKSLIRYDGSEFREYVWNDVANDSDRIVSIIPEDDCIWVVFRYGGLMRFANGEFKDPTAGLSEINEDIKSGKGRIFNINGMEIENIPENQIFILNGKKYMKSSSPIR